MKVFLSWSGNKSHKVAKVFRDWFPSVIQSIEPYVSSEDIDKGARWSTDIAKELEDSTFGILCVTKDNINEPWLTFEAGALSKTMDKSFVSPFLFDIKRSEVDGPILQFQSTIFQKDDIKKLIKTLNKACGKNKLADEQLEKAFDVWYPTLENELNKIKKVPQEPSPDIKSKKEDIHASEILEEILDLSRINQKLLRNPEGLYIASEEIKNNLREIMLRLERRPDISPSRISRKIMNPMFFEELMHILPMDRKNYIGLQIILSPFRDDYPWVDDAGKEVIEILKSKKAKNEKIKAVEEFANMIEFTSEHPIMREFHGTNKEIRMILRDLSMLFRRYFEEMM